MGDKTKISWTDATWNPIRGCRRTAPEGSKQSGCGDPSGGGCYAERQAARFCGPGQPYEGLIMETANGPRWTGKTRFVSEHLRDPLRWTKQRRIFTDSMSDLFYEGIPTAWVDSIVAVMMICALRDDGANHIFQTLTKRAHRMRDYFTDPKAQERVARAAGQMMEDGDGWFDAIAFRKEGLVHPNLWWGVSVENQPAAYDRIDDLLMTPAAVRFLSIEPMLGPVDLLPWFDPTGACDCAPDSRQCEPRCMRDAEWRGAETKEGDEVLVDPELHWVIVGCESGPRAREAELEWVRAVRDCCAEYAVPFHLKQAKPVEGSATITDIRPIPQVLGRIGELIPTIGIGPNSEEKGGGVVQLPYLDGVQHAAFPELPWHAAFPEIS